MKIIITNTTDIKMVRKYFEQLFADKFINLNNKFVE